MSPPRTCPHSQPESTTFTSMTLPPCPYCEKQGLPILLTRYGIAPEKTFMARPGKPPAGKAAPKAAATVGDPTPAIPLGKTTEAHYTVRSLRGGYVYVYYEVSKSWEAYAVDNEGRLTSVSLDGYMPPQAWPFHAACARNMQKVANASLLTILDPKTAGKVWFGFSDAWWTAAVRTDNESESVRRHHMRCIDVGGWYNDNQPAKVPAHASAMTNVDAVVADYAMSGDDCRRLFFWSPFPGLRHDGLQIPRAHALKAESQRLLKDKGLVVVLDDPVAILQEISAYIDKRWYSFMSQNDAKDPLHPGETWRRKSALSSALDVLKQRVEREAEASVYGDARAAHENIEWLDGGDGRRVYNVALSSPDYRKLAQPILDEKVSQADLDMARKKRWGAYAKLFDPAQREAFEKRYEAASALYDAEYTAPLANAHAAWLRSAKLHAVFDHHFDMHDINSGVAFSGVALSCMRGTGGLGACMQVYSDWYEQPIDRSPIWRAKLLNHQPLLQAVDSVSGSADSPFTNVDNWINLSVVYSTAVEKIKARGAALSAPGTRANAIESVDVLPALLQELGVLPMTRLTKGGKAGTALLATLGMRAGHPVRWVQVVGTRRDFFMSVMEVIQASQKKRGISLGNLQYSLKDQLRMFGIEGVALDEKIQFWTVVFDEQAQRDLANQRVPPAQRGDALGKTLKVVTVEEFSKSTLARTVEFATRPGSLAGVGLLLSCLGLQQAGSADASMKHLQTRAVMKIFALYSAGAGSLLELVRVGAKVVKEAKETRIPLLSPWLSARLGERGFMIWEGVGGVAVGVGTIILGLIDLQNAIESEKRKQPGMLVLYAINSGSEFAVGGYTAAIGVRLIIWRVVTGFSPVIFWLTAVIFVASIIIEVEKDPPTIDWVRQCLWGKENNYKSEAEELDNFDKALIG
ncbi:T6SS effector BTH_I2691 family protein [Burkholderia ubonensis]|uniref:T6SS effector BTH_I2691 family protein n=2 Tax=Burkholderia ubonensis TaxID=101571 RepID=UPI002FCC042B